MTDWLSHCKFQILFCSGVGKGSWFVGTLGGVPPILWKAFSFGEVIAFALSHSEGVEPIPMRGSFLSETIRIVGRGWLCTNVSPFLLISLFPFPVELGEAEIGRKKDRVNGEDHHSIFLGRLPGLEERLRKCNKSAKNAFSNSPPATRPKKTKSVLIFGPKSPKKLDSKS